MPTKIIALVLLALAFGSLGSPRAGELEGHWEGSISQPSGELKIALDISAGAGSGTFDLPAAAIFRWPAKIGYASPTVSVRLPNGMTFEGELRGDTVSGKIPSPAGPADPFSLKRRPLAPAPYRDEEVTFQSGGFTLSGTLRLPLAASRHPAVLLMTGSGDVDREGESFYADYFARHGIATLAYDKRGTGRSGGDHRDQSFNDFAADALAGIHFLQSRSEIDPRRTGLYGRSHGGMVVPLAASLSNDVAFIINVGGAGVSPHQQMTYQTEAQMRRDGFSEADIAEAVAYMNQKWDVARTGGEGWQKLQAATENARGAKWLPRVQPASRLEDIVPSWKLQMGYDPMPALRLVRCPILAVFGEADTLTPVPQTLANYRHGVQASGNKDATLTVFPDADHSLLVWPRPGGPSHWPVLAPGLLDTMTEWIKKH